MFEEIRSQIIATSDNKFGYFVGDKDKAFNLTLSRVSAYKIKELAHHSVIYFHNGVILVSDISDDYGFQVNERINGEMVFIGDMPKCIKIISSYNLFGDKLERAIYVPQNQENPHGLLVGYLLYEVAFNGFSNAKDYWGYTESTKDDFPTPPIRKFLINKYENDRYTVISQIL